METEIDRLRLVAEIFVARARGSRVRGLAIEKAGRAAAAEHDKHVAFAGPSYVAARNMLK